MVVSTTSDEWENGDEVTAYYNQVLEFLQENPDRAYHLRELADEVLETDWELSHEEERERQRLGEEEFQRRVNNGEYDGKFDTDLSESFIERSQTDILRAVLDLLIEEEKVEARTLPQDATEIPYEDFGEVLHFTYAG